MKAFALAWGPKYIEYVPRWEESCRRFGLEPRAEIIESPAPSPVEAYKLRAVLVLREALETKEPFVYMDVDGEVKSRPDLLTMADSMFYDFANVDNRPGAPEVQTLLVLPTRKALETLQVWNELFRDFPRMVRSRTVTELSPDVETFQMAYKKTGARRLVLPHGYAWVDDWYRGRIGRQSPVIEYNHPLKKVAHA